ncbi:MAG: tRNA pseudouridine(38-40) synthase TruA [Acidobacteriota bacterium]
MKTNFRLLIQYDGTDFHGWQVQESERTVQGELTRAVSIIEGEEVFVCGSGRTDAGVHAEGQVANIKISREIGPDKLKSALNGNLPFDVRILAVDAVDDSFHSRFSAIGKTYRYRVVNSSVMSPLFSRFASLEYRELNLEKMIEGALAFVGQHDWTAFSAAQSDSEDKVRTVSKFSVTSHFSEIANGNVFEFEVTGDGFLRYMVRAMVGTLLEVGRGERSAVSIAEAIQSRDRSLSGPTAPASGLTLVRVYY